MNEKQKYEIKYLISFTTHASFQFSIPDPQCKSDIALELDVPLVYLTVSAKASVSWIGSVDSRHLVLNWQRPKVVNSTDWVGIFDKDMKRKNYVRSNKPIWKISFTFCIIFLILLT